MADNLKSCHRRDAHDNSGYDTEMMDFSEYDDGYGNNVASGDQSMLHMVQRGSRDPWATTPGGDEGFGAAESPRPLDTEPFQSRAQQRYMHAAAGRGDIARSVVKEYDRSTDFSRLPERKK